MEMQIGWLSLAFSCHFVPASLFMRCTSALMSDWIHVFWIPGISYFNWMKSSIFSTFPFYLFCSLASSTWEYLNCRNLLVMWTASCRREPMNTGQHKLINLLNTLWDFGERFMFSLELKVRVLSPCVLSMTVLCCNVKRQRPRKSSFLSLWNFNLSEEFESINIILWKKESKKERKEERKKERRERICIHYIYTWF